jgi:hypothetical protein
MSVPKGRPGSQIGSKPIALAWFLFQLLCPACRKVDRPEPKIPQTRDSAAPTPEVKASPPVTISFDDVRYGFAISPCSPQFVDEEPDGFKIAAPATFSLSTRDKSGERAMLPLCMTLRFDRLYLSRFQQVFQAVKVVAVDDEHGKTLSSGVWRDRHYRPNPPSDIPPEELKRRIGTEYCTVNPRELMRFPRRKAT